MDEYRKLAHLKYLKHVESETEFNDVKKKLDDDFENMTFDLINNLIKSIEENIVDDIDNDVTVLTKTFFDNIDFFEKETKLVN